MTILYLRKNSTHTKILFITCKEKKLFYSSAVININCLRFSCLHKLGNLFYPNISTEKSRRHLWDFFLWRQWRNLNPFGRFVGRKYFTSSTAATNLRDFILLKKKNNQKKAWSSSFGISLELSALFTAATLHLLELLSFYFEYQKYCAIGLFSKKVCAAICKLKL